MLPSGSLLVLNFRLSASAKTMHVFVESALTSEVEKVHIQILFGEKTRTDSLLYSSKSDKAQALKLTQVIKVKRTSGNCNRQFLCNAN